MGSSFSMFKIITEGKAASRFLAAALLSFAFSIAVILSTIGLMDGFEQTLRTALKSSTGDYQVVSEKGFFLYQSVSEALAESATSPVLEIEAFAVANEKNKGVLVKGVEKKSFERVADLKFTLSEKGAVIGHELAASLGVGRGDELTLTFASDQMRDQGGAILKRFLIEDVVSHGIYEKDLRFVYLDLDTLGSIFGYKKGAVNKVLASAPAEHSFEAGMRLFEGRLPEKFRVEPFWDEYKTLLKAVEVEKASIGMVLQIIVIVAIFNVVAFIIFISEKKSQEFFLLRAFGVSLKKISSFWRSLLFWMWLVSALLSVGLTHVFNFLLMRLPVFDLPGDIYVLSNLRLALGWEDYALVFSLALGWVLLIGSLTMWRMKKRAVLSGLRQEFK